MKKAIPITPAEVIKRMIDIPKILDWSRNKHMIVSGPEFWGIHHIFIDKHLKHVVICLKSDYTAHTFIGNPVRASEWRKYDKDQKVILNKTFDEKVLEWKIYKDLVLYRGETLPPKEIQAEPYWGEVVGVEDFDDEINDDWLIYEIRKLFRGD